MNEYIKNESESSPGSYEVYYDASGTKFIVLSGLSIEDQPITPTLQNFIHEHYDFFVGFYSLALVATLTYVASRNVITPLLRRHLTKR